jgi:hypothetical protein
LKCLPLARVLFSGCGCGFLGGGVQLALAILARHHLVSPLTSWQISALPS